MTKPSYIGANVEVDIDTFASFVAKVNWIIDDMGHTVVTVAPVDQANSTNGAVSVGNAHVEGVLSTVVSVAEELRGGIMSSPNTLSLSSNVAPKAGVIVSVGEPARRINSSFFSNSDIVTANIGTAGITNATVRQVLTGNVANIVTGNVVTLTSNNATVMTGNVVTLTSNNATVTTGNVVTLTSNNATVTTGNVVTLTSNNATVTTGNVATLNSTLANITTANTITMTANNATVRQVLTGNVVNVVSANATNITTNNATVRQVLTGNVANIITGNVVTLTSNNTTVTNTLTGNVVNIVSANATNITTNNATVRQVLTGNTGNFVALSSNTANLVSVSANTANIRSVDANTITTQSIASTGNGLNDFSGNLIIRGDLTVEGTTSLASDNALAVNTSIATYLTVNTLADFKGDVIVGDAAADLITFNSRVNSAFIPNTNNTRDLGTSALRFRTLYAVNVDSTNLSGNGSGLTALNASQLTTGTLPAGRLSGSYSFNNLSLSGLVVSTNQANNTFNQNYVRFEPTDWGIGKPYLSIRTTANSNDSWAIGLWDGATNNGSLNISATNFTHNNNTVWTSGNMGTGSGLDAGLLNGQAGSYYQNLNNSTGILKNSSLSGDYSFANLTLSGTINANGSGLTNLNSSALTGTIADARLPSTQAGKTFSSAINVRAGAAASQILYAKFEPTDFGVGKPYMSIHTQPGNDDAWNIGLWDGASGSGTINIQSTDFTHLNHKVWTAGNMGGGSGLNADVLDGQHGGWYQNLANSTGTLPNARLAGDYSFTNLTLSGTITGNGSGLTALNASNISTGTLPDARLAGNYSFTNLTLSGTITGNGSGLTALNASQLTTGTLPNGRLAGNYSFGGLTLTAALSGTTASFSGAISGTGAGITGLNASNISSGTLNNARLAGDYSFNKLTLNSTSVANNTSTLHAFQIGPNNARNLRMDNLGNIIALNNGVPQPITFNSLSITNTVTAHNFSGQGSLLTDLNANQLTSGTIANARLSGPYSWNQLNLTNTSYANTSSTNHAFQIGPTNGYNLRIGNRNIASVNNGAFAALAIQTQGGNVIIGSDSAAVDLRGSVTMSGNPVPSVYTGGGINNTNFPIGTILMCGTASTTNMDRNSAQIVSLSSNTTQFWINQAGQTNLAGTWRSCGVAGGQYIMMQRTA